MRVYLDNAATTPLSPEVLEAMMPYLTEYFGNPSSPHWFGRKARTAVENARRTIARLLNCLPSEIFFTSGGTEADNLAIHTAVKDLGCSRIITSAIEHSAVLKTAEKLAASGRVQLHFVHLESDGHIDLNHLEQLLDHPEKTLVSLMHGNNEIANLLPIYEVADICQRYNAIFHSDTVQTMGHYSFDLKQLPIHFITASGHKFHGPKGIGFIYVNHNIKINADITGGGQERGIRGGTENSYGIIGLAKALDLAYAGIKQHRAHVSALKQYMIQQLSREIPGIIFNGDSISEDSLYTVLNVTFPENNNSDMLVFLLDLEGVAASGGSACSSGASKGSHVLEALHAIRPGQASIRFSFSRNTTQQEIDFALEKIKILNDVPIVHL